MRAAALLLVMAACGGARPNATQPEPSSAPKEVAPAKVGDRMTPIPGPLAIPAKGAKLTMVNYFATWCTSSQRWMPNVEAMRTKYGARLAVIGVANYDEASQAELESFVKGSGGTFPVSADKDHRIVQTLAPSGWGQAIVVVDAQGVVRLVHRGTREGDFERVDAEIGRLLAP